MGPSPRRCPAPSLAGWQAFTSELREKLTLANREVRLRTRGVPSEVRLAETDIMKGVRR